MGLSSLRFKMKVIVASLLLLSLASAQDSRTVRKRVKDQIRQWASVQAHCAEASNTEGSIQPEMALKCKKCEASGGEDMNLALLCVFNHLTDNHKHAQNVLFGSSDDNPMKPSKMEIVVESIFNEGRCIHANEGNNNRIQECAMCFNHVVMKERKLLMEMKFQKKHGLEGPDDEEYFEMGRKIGSMWSACSDVYLSPVYSECTENVEELLEADMAEWITEEFRNKQKEIEGCMLLKQSKYYYKDCTAAGGEGWMAS